MGFLGFGRRGLRSPDPRLRQEAILRLGDGAQARFLELAANDEDAGIRLLAARRVRGWEQLRLLARSSDERVCAVAAEGLAAEAPRRLLKASPAEADDLVPLVQDQNGLVEAALHAADAGVRRKVGERLLADQTISEATLRTLAIQDADGDLGVAVVPRLAARGLLKEIARKAKHQAVQVAAAQRRDELAAAAAAPSPEQRRRQRRERLAPLKDRAEVLAQASDWDSLEARWQALTQERQAILDDHPGLELEEAAEELVAAIDRARARSDQRRAAAAALAVAVAAAEAAIGRRREGTEDEAWATLLAAVDDDGERRRLEAAWMAAAPKPVAAGPEPDDQAPPTDTPPPRPELDAEELARARATCEQAAAIAADGDLRTARDRMLVLDREWHRLTDGAAIPDDLRQAWRRARDTLHERRATARAERDRDREERNQRLTAIATRAEALARTCTGLAEDGERARSIAAGLRSLRQEWRRAGPAGGERLAEARGRYEAAVATIDAAITEAFQALDWERFAHASEAEKLIAAAEALAASLAPEPTRNEPTSGDEPATSGDEPATSGDEPATSGDEHQPVTAAEPAATDAQPQPTRAGNPAPGASEPAELVRQVKALQRQWKELGPLPRDRREALWQRFRTACDAVFAALQPWFAARDAERATNLEAKRALVSELEVLLDSDPVGLAGSPALRDEAHRRHERVQEINSRWKATGPVPRDEAGPLNDRYRALLDKHYGARRSARAVLDQERSQNLEAKELLLQRLDRLLADVERWRTGSLPGVKEPELLKRVRELQQQWRNTGHVPRERMDEINGRFRAGCDTVYAACESFLQQEDEQRRDNLAAKEALLVEFAEVFEEEHPHWFREQVGELRQRWRDVGPLPRADVDRIESAFRDLQRRFDEACDAAGVSGPER